MKIINMASDKLNKLSLGQQPVVLNLKIQKDKDNYQVITVKSDELNKIEHLENVKYPDENNVVNIDNPNLPKQEEKKQCGCGYPDSIQTQECGCTNPHNRKLYDFTDKTDEAKITENSFDPYEYYRRHQEYIQTFMEDPMTRGANINDNYAPVSSIGMQKNEKINTYPKPDGFIFNT